MHTRCTLLLLLALATTTLVSAASAQLLLPTPHPLDYQCTQYSTNQGFAACGTCHFNALTCTSCHYYQLVVAASRALDNEADLAWKACWDCHVNTSSTLYQLCTQGRGGVPPPTINLTNVHDVHHILLNVTNVTDIQWQSSIVAAGYPPRPVSCACHAIYHAHPHDFEDVTPYNWSNGAVVPAFTPIWGMLFLLPTASLNNGSKPNATIPSTAPGTGSFKVYFAPFNDYTALRYDPILNSYYGGYYGVFVGLVAIFSHSPYGAVFLAFTNRSNPAVPRGYYRDLYPLQLSNATLRTSEQAVTWVKIAYTYGWIPVEGNNSASAIAYNRLTAYACMTCHFNATRAGVSLLGEPAGSRRVELPAVELAVPLKMVGVAVGEAAPKGGGGWGLLAAATATIALVSAALAAVGVRRWGR